MPNLPLLVEWSPTRVRIVDPGSGAVTHGATIAACAPEAGRDAVIAFGRRSAFVRATFVPGGSAAAVEEVLAFGMAQTLPLPANEAVLGYRLGESVAGKGRRASVGAVRSESLVRAFADAQAAGLRVRAALPVAYGSWLAARARGMRDAAVVSVEDGALGIDLVRDGELIYSRAVPTEDPLGDAEDEVARSLVIAETPSLPTLALAAPTAPADAHEARESLAFLADLPSIDRLLFSLEPPARRAARRRRRERWKAQRALLAALAAVGLVAYDVGSHLRTAKTTSKSSTAESALTKARREGSGAQARLDRAERANRVLDVAFGPAQTVTDVVRALSVATAEGAWLTGLSVGRNAPILATGFAMRGGDVSRLLATLSGDPRFHDVRLVSTNKAVVGKTPVTQFALSGGAVGVPPFDRPMKMEKKAPVKARRNDR